MLRISGRQDNLYDIPAFLRKQAPDKDAAYRDDLHRFAASLAAARSKASQTMPTSLRDIAAELPKELIDELQALINEGFKEVDVVNAFVEAVVKRFRGDGVTRRIFDVLRRWSAKRNPTLSDVERRVQSILLNVVGERAPSGPNQIPAWLLRAGD
jgi:hypothetical protein